MLTIQLNAQDGGPEDENMENVVSGWMKTISKQIEAQARPVREKMNRYEKSIVLLNTAMNLLDPKCDEFLECMIESAKCKRLLAVNKKHLRAVWRQDAATIDQELNESLADATKPLEDEFEDSNANYKEEALKSFVEILSNEEIFKRVTAHSLLGTLAIEYAECRGNLNKEQCFASLALYQYAVSREELKKCYFKACDPTHTDVLKQKQITKSKLPFSF
jgi:hypothetical protein